MTGPVFALCLVAIAREAVIPLGAGDVLVRGSGVAQLRLSRADRLTQRPDHGVEHGSAVGAQKFITDRLSHDVRSTALSDTHGLRVNAHLTKRGVGQGGQFRGRVRHVGYAFICGQTCQEPRKNLHLNLGRTE